MFLVTHKKPHAVGAFLLLMLSALMYAASLMTVSLWWCALFFWMPLCVSVYLYSGGFWWGFAWGVVAYGFLYSFTVPVVYYYGHGFLRIGVYPCLVMYLAVWSGLLLHGVSCVPNGWRLVSMPLLLCGYFYFCNHGVFIGLGVMQGNPLFSPVLPLLYCAQQEAIPGVAVIRVEDASSDPRELGRQIAYAMLAVKNQHPDVRVMVTPESLFPYPLNEYRDVLNMWRENVLCDGVTLCCGAYRSNDCVLYNALYVITESGMQWYDKRDLCYVTESVSAWGALLGLESLFLSGATVFTCGANKRKPIHIPGFGDCVPYLCSELLLTHGVYDEHPELPIICLANDSWFFCHYMPRLMALQARYKAWVSGRSVLYVSYNHLVFLCSSINFDYL